MTKREEVTRYLDQLLDSARFKDYCPNGLQVEGRPEIRHIVAGVTANQALTDAAVERGADTLLVHHGWFWRGEDGRVVGLRKRRLQTLLANDLNLIGYHLPLDGHAELGNNAQLAARLGWIPDGRFGDQEIGWLGRPQNPLPLGKLGRDIALSLGREPLVIGEATRPVARIAWCTGAAQDFFDEAIAAGADAFVTGEISERHVHTARESGVAFIAAGHHATERYGVQAVAVNVAARFGLRCEFIDIDNPV